VTPVVSNGVRTWLYLAVLFVALVIVVIAQVASQPATPREGPAAVSPAPALLGAPPVIAEDIGAPRVAIDTALLGGVASWYDDGPGLYGAAGPVLREALGGDPAFRGEHVRVCADACVTVVLSDWCACGERAGKATLVDLSPAAFRRLAPLSAGVVRITIETGAAPQRLPNTDTLEVQP
jgi:rare lipoprotein A (RlpA)-like double-psi beta-barrel protein